MESYPRPDDSDGGMFPTSGGPISTGTERKQIDGLVERTLQTHEYLRTKASGAGTVAFILVAVNSPPASPENAFEHHLPAGWRSNPPDARFRRILVVDRS